MPGIGQRLMEDWSIEGKTLTEATSGDMQSTTKFTAAESKKSGTFERTYEFTDERRMGAYRLEGDTLKLYTDYSRQNDHPKTFPDEPEHGLLHVYKRFGDPQGDGLDGDWIEFEFIVNKKHSPRSGTLMRIKGTENWQISFIRTQSTLDHDPLIPNQFTTTHENTKRSRGYRLDGDRLTVWHLPLSPEGVFSDAKDSPTLFRVFERVKP